MNEKVFPWMEIKNEMKVNGKGKIGASDFDAIRLIFIIYSTFSTINQVGISPHSRSLFQSHPLRWE